MSSSGRNPHAATARCTGADDPPAAVGAAVRGGKSRGGRQGAFHRRILTAVVAALLPAICWTGTARASYLIRPDGTGDFPTIQAAIDAVVDGDIIELTDGTFTGEGNRDLDYRGKAITVRKRPGNLEACIIDCEGRAGDPHRGFLFISGEGPASRLEEVIVTGGYAMSEQWPAGFGGGVFCRGGSPTLLKCAFIADSSTYGVGSPAPIPPPRR